MRFYRSIFEKRKAVGYDISLGNRWDGWLVHDKVSENFTLVFRSGLPKFVNWTERFHSVVRQILKPLYYLLWDHLKSMYTETTLHTFAFINVSTIGFAILASRWEQFKEWVIQCWDVATCKHRKCHIMHISMFWIRMFNYLWLLCII